MHKAGTLEVVSLFHNPKYAIIVPIPPIPLIEVGVTVEGNEEVGVNGVAILTTPFPIILTIKVIITVTPLRLGIENIQTPIIPTPNITANPLWPPTTGSLPLGIHVTMIIDLILEMFMNNHLMGIINHTLTHTVVRFFTRTPCCKKGVQTQERHKRREENTKEENEGELDGSRRF